MDQILKQARLLKAEATNEDLARINTQALRPLGADEVFIFRLAACNNQVDRDIERFTEDTLKALAKLFVGRPVLLDHKWSAGSQTARVYAAGVEAMPGVEGGRQLVLRCYMPRLQGNGDTIAAIESGLLRECSVGVAVERALCSICGADRHTTWCDHRKGVEYPGGTQFLDDETGDAVWISAAKEGTVPTPSHYAWRAKTTDDVQAFYDAALDGGTDNGAPGPRDYHPGYYACFVLDPEGNNIEAVLHDYEG